MVVEIDVTSCWEELQRIMATFAILQVVRKKRDDWKEIRGQQSNNKLLDIFLLLKSQK